MPKIIEGVSSIVGKLAGLHAGGQYGFIYDLNGFQIAPAGMDGGGKSTVANSLGLSGAPVGVVGFPPITLSRQVGAVGNVTTGATTLYTATVKAKTMT